jgi:hypothetical protein
MAKIVLGMAAPHSTMLGKDPDTWLEDGLRDRNNKELWFRKNVYNSYEALEAVRRNDHFERLITVEERRSRFAKCRKAIDVLRRVYQETEIDIAVVIGKDQKEIFIDLTPTFAVHVTDGIENGPPQKPIYAPDKPVAYPGARELSLNLLNHLQADGFDIACMTKMPPNVWLQNNIVVPHAFSFIYHEIMLDKAPPSVPVYLNTFYPPNQPSMKRCIAFGKSLTRAIESWDGKLRVGLFASGGFSHFVVDEEFDRKTLESFKKADLDALAAVDERYYQSGTSEVKLFVPILIAMAAQNCPVNVVDYVPCYRTEAGTGEGMAFMYWKP